MANETRRNGRTYYYQKQRHGARVVSVYFGSGPLAIRAQHAQEAAQERRAAERAARERVRALATAPACVPAYHAQIRCTVHAVLHRLGFHQHKRQWRRRMTQTTTALTKDERRARWREAQTLLTKKAWTPDERQRFRAALDAIPELVLDCGDMPEQVRRALLTGYAGEGIKTAIDRRMQQLARDLGYEQATRLERLLIDDMLICWLELYQFQAGQAMQNESSVNLAQQTAVEPILNAKHRRYLRSIEALARVRRLLKLTIQINIAQDGGQQVNVQQ